MTKQDIQQQLKQAMITKDAQKTSTLRMLLSAIQVSEVQGEKHDATEEEILTVLNRETKRRRESIEEYKKGGREDLVNQETAELELLESFLPQQLTPDELRSIIAQAINTVGTTSSSDFGKVMKEVSAKTKGRADGKMVSELVKTMLTG